jgi:hypothetical protein
VQVPQLDTVRVAPQLSAPVTLPQFFPSREQKAALVSGLQAQTLATPPPPHVCGLVQVPQLDTVRVAPQLSVPVTVPQLFPSREQKVPFVSGEQPQTLGEPPPPHVLGRVQLPQLTVRAVPQLSVASA